MTGRRLAIAALAAFLAVGPAGCTDDPPPARTRLRVEVTGLPSGVAGRVVVEGRVRYTLGGTDERDVPPGSYTIEVGDVRGPASRVLPVDRTTTVEVPPNTTGTAAAAYRVVIPDATTVLDPARPGITGVSGATVRFARDAPQVATLVPGRVFIVGEGPRTPTVLIRRVLAITRTRTEVVVTTRAARLDEALPAGVIRIDTGPAPLSADPPGGSENPLLSFDLGSKDLEADEKRNGCKLVGRDQGTEVKFELSSLRLRPRLDLGWDASGMYVTAGLTVSVEQSFSAEVRRAVDCTWKLDEDTARTTLDRICRRQLGKILHIGVIRLACRATPVGTLTVKTQAQLASFEQSTTASKSFAATFPPDHAAKDPGKLDKASVDPRVKIPPIDSNATGEVEVSGNGGLKFGLTGGDVLGVVTVQLAIRATIGGKFAIDTGGHVRASIPAEVALTADLALDPIIKKKWEKSADLIAWHENLWEWTTDKSGGTIGKSPGPSPPAAPEAGPVAVKHDGTLSLVDPRTGTVRRLAGAVVPVRWSPDGSRLAGVSQSPGGRLRVWNADGTSAGSVGMCAGCSYDFAFIDDSLVVVLESTLQRHPESSNLGNRLAYYDLRSGRRIRVVPTTRISGLAGTTGAGLLAIASVPRAQGTPDQSSAPVDLVWLDRDGRPTRSTRLSDGCPVGDTATSADGRKLAVLLECGGPEMALVVVDTATGAVERPGRPLPASYLLDDLRWSHQGALFVQSFDLDQVAAPRLFAYQSGRWHTVDTDAVRSARSTPRVQVVVTDDRKPAFAGGELYLLRGRPTGPAGDSYAQPSADDRPVITGVHQIWFPPGPEEPVAVG